MKTKRKTQAEGGMTARVRQELEALAALGDGADGAETTEARSSYPGGEVPGQAGAIPGQASPAPENGEAEARSAALSRAALWERQAAELRELIPDFDLARESADPAFRGLLDRGLTVKQAFILCYFDKLLAAAVRLSAEETERRVVANLRAKGNRPPENGVAGQGPFLLGGAAGLSRKQRAEIAERARRGETVRL